MSTGAQISGLTHISHHDLGGYGDGMQLQRVNDLLYVAHYGATPMALSILDVSDLRSPRVVRQVERPPNSHCHKLQIAGDVLLMNFERQFGLDEDVQPPAVTGLGVYTLENPTQPEMVGFLDFPGRGVHRMWFVDGRYAHIAAFIEEVSHRCYVIVDLADPSAPEVVGQWWIPGSHPGDEERWDAFGFGPANRVHGVITHGNRAYVACTDSGVAILDISDIHQPQLVSRISWSPPYGGCVHTALPLPDRDLLVASDEALGNAPEDGDKRIWIVNIAEERQPVSIATCPVPQPPSASPWRTYHDRPLRFGPHNLHENRTGSFQSEDTIFATYFNAGLRVYELTDPHHPTEIAHYVPPAPEGQAAPLTNDLYVDRDGVIYITDRISGGLNILKI